MLRIHSLFSTLLMSGCLLFLLACSQETTRAPACSEASADTAPVTSSGLLYVGVDVGFTSSSVYAFDAENKESAVILPGQSGDFVLLQDRGRIFGFNRKADNLNMREIKADGEIYTCGSQLALPQNLIGDPHDILLLSDNHLLLSGFNSHALHVLDPHDGTIQQTLSAEWDIPGGGPFFPSDLVRFDEHRLAVVHHGYAADFSSTAAGTIFEMQWDGSVLSPIDLDAQKVGVQGHNLLSHIPSGLYPLGEDTFLVAGLCADWSSTCVAAFETFDAKNGSLSRMDFSPLDEVDAYGAFVQASPTQFYGQIKRSSGTGEETESGQAVLAHFDLAADALTNVLIYQDVNGDSFEDTGLLVFAPELERLFVGEPTSDKEGKIRIFAGGKEEESIVTPAIPKHGLHITENGVAN